MITPGASPAAESRFANRRQAGVALARRLSHLAGRDDVVVLGLPRGGVPVAYEVARALQAPLDVFVVRKLGLPGHEEYAIGAIASGDIRVINRDAVSLYQLPDAVIDAVARAELGELERRERAYRIGRTPASLEGRVVVLVDDGLATGSTMRAAVLAVRQRHPSRIVVAVPVGARDTCREIGETADEVVCVSMPEPFRAVGLWYEDFSQTSDDEVRLLLAAVPVRPPLERSA
jgi:predicted phosphoribosyltransferase